MKRSTWRKSSYSSDQGGNCLEVAGLDDGRAVRDSKDPTGPVLRFTTAEWSAFTAGVADAVAWCAGAGHHWRALIAPILHQ